MTTLLLVDDDPLQARVRKSMLGRHFATIERASDVAEAFILVEDLAFAQQLGLVIVCLSRPGLGSPAFVAELTSRLPSVPVLVLGSTREEAAFYEGPTVRFLPRTAPAEQLIALSRKMVQQFNARVA
jgi:CheY-like chemotaxis protein